jgi:hypothetical protein
MSFHHDPKVHCQNLRAKEMFAQEPRDVAREEALAEEYGAYETTAFWCQLTQTGRGPDGRRANGRECCRARPCFLGIEEIE